MNEGTPQGVLFGVLKLVVGMQPGVRTIVLMTGAAPYLGGPQTWRALRAAAPEFAYAEIDPLDFVDTPDIAEAMGERISSTAGGIAAIVAHGSAARIAIDAVTRRSLAVPLLLLSPMVATRNTRLAALVRAIVGSGAGRRFLAGMARTKLRRLASDGAFVRKQLSLLVADEAITEPLLDEARARLNDPRTAAAIPRTADALLLALRPVQLPAEGTYRALLGDSPLDRKMAQRMPAEVVPGIAGAAMLEAPERVARTLREMLGSA